MDILRELRFWQGAVAGFSFAAGIDFFLKNSTITQKKIFRFDLVHTYKT